MKRLLTTIRWAVLAASCAGILFAQNYTLKLTGANPGNWVMGGVYTSPYTFQVTGNGGTATGILLTCDDFLTDVYLGETWQATQAHLQTDIMGETTANDSVKFDHSPTSPAQQIRDYSAVVYLAAELLKWGSQHGFGNDTAGEYSYAIWGVFDAPLLTNSFQQSLANNAEGKLTATQLAAAQSLLQQAFNFVDSGGIVADGYIYTSIPQSAAQEFIQVSGTNHVVSMFEPSSTAGLMTELTLVLGLVIGFRRQRKSQAR